MVFCREPFIKERTPVCPFAYLEFTKCAWEGFSILLPLDDEVGDVYVGCSLFVCGAALEDVANYDVQVYGEEFAFPFFVAVNVGECYGSASSEDGEFVLGELGFASSGEP